MIHRLFDKNLLSVWGANGVTVFISLLPDIEAVLRIVAVLLGIGYTVWKWKKELKKHKTPEVK